MDEEEKEGVAKRLGFTFGRVVFLIILIVSVNLAIRYVDGKLYKHDNSDNDIVESNQNVHYTGYVNKLDDSKEYVYRASYDNDGIVDSYSTLYKTYYLDNIVVPYINIDSEDALKVNAEIKSVYDSAIETYKKGIEDKMSYVDDCSYRFFVNDNILSVVLTYGKGATDVVHPSYYTYNFDLKTGRLVSYEDIYSYVGFNSDNISQSVKSSITTVMTERMSKFPDSLKEDFDTYNSQSYDNYISLINDSSIKYFISSNKKLNVIVTLSIPAGTGEFDTVVTIN